MSQSLQNNVSTFYLIWIGLFLYKELYYGYLETTTSPVSATCHNKLGEFLSSYCISEEVPDPGSSLQEKISREFIGSRTKGAD